jgi:mono/diheme cytochrome c family protein
MVLRAGVLFASIFLITACGSDASHKDAIPEETPEEKGASLFILNCASCHGEDGKLGSSDAKDLSVSKLSGKEIEKIIREGKNSMPSQEAVLETEENIQLVIEHVKSLRK